MPLSALSLAIVGAQYPNTDKKAPTRLFAIGLCRPGDPVELVPEPKNPADPNAVAVFNSAGMMMGYLTAERAPWIGKLIREGREVAAIFQAAVDNGAWIRAAFDGEQPNLPAQRLPAEPATEQADDSGWYPDEIYPDD